MNDEKRSEKNKSNFGYLIGLNYFVWLLDQSVKTLRGHNLYLI